MNKLHFRSRRSGVLARHGMVATSQPLAAMEGLRVLMDGGHAADAAVTTASMLNVVEPMSTGVGGDCFALVYDAASGRVFALNASGSSPAAFGLGEARRMGLDAIPLTGPLPVTVPGTVSGWSALVERFGRRSLAECLAPAIRTAEEGFPVSERISAGWQASAAKLSLNTEASRVYLPAPRPGQIHRQPDLAKTLRTIGEGGAHEFYAGDMARRIAQCVQDQGGFLAAGDLAAHRATWHEPIRIAYRDVEVLEHPPNGQGLAALLALQIVEGYDRKASAYYAPSRWHAMIEAMRLGMADAARFVADPDLAPAPLGQLLSKEYASGRRRQIDPQRTMEIATAGSPEHRDTVYLTVVDSQGNAVSFINSLYYGFGSGLVVPGTGICLQNRGACFSLEEGHPNALAGGKRPYHTIIPAMAMRGGKLWLSFGVMGGFMQPQGHLQVIVNMVDYGLDPQAALDAPRFRVNERGRNSVAIERGVPPALLKGLRDRGHQVVLEPAFAPAFGGGQVIAFEPETGVLWGGSDPRRDGCAVGY